MLFALILAKKQIRQEYESYKAQMDRHKTQYKVIEETEQPDVRFLCGGGFVKEDQSQWKWERTAGDGALVKVRDGVQAAASAYFYATDDGRLHWVKRGSALAPVSKSVRNITPVLRNTVLLLFLSLWLLRRRRKKVQPKGEFNNPQQENL